MGFVSLFCITISLTLLFKSYQSAAPIEFSEATVAGVLSGITIDIEGAVNHPGVYELPLGARVEDAIVAAGGFSSDADEDAIGKTVNRAVKISDGAKLYIPKTGQTTAVSGNISINASSQSELESLSGVGPATAKKIMGGRPYQTLEELVSKKAIGQALFDKIKDQLSL